MIIRQPTSGSKRALLIIDVQPATFNSPGAHDVLNRIRRYVENAPYDAYLVATFSAPNQSMFGRQLGWTLTSDLAGQTDAETLQAVKAKAKPVLEISKTVRSIFKGDSGAKAVAFLEDCKIDEVHLLGYDINDCILATAYDALDRGLFSYAIEECCARTDSNPGVTEAALTVLRKQAMTNGSTRHQWASVDIPPSANCA